MHARRASCDIHLSDITHAALVPCRYLDECPRDLGVYVGIIRLLDNHEASFSNPSHLVEL